MDESPMLLSLFATPLLAERLDPVLCEEAKHVLLAEMALHAGISRSVVGGWHGLPNLATRTDRVWQELTSSVARTVRLAHDQQGVSLGLAPSVEPMAFEGWGTVLVGGAYVVPHDHAGAQWSAVCYLDSGDAAPAERPESGALVLTDPRGAITGAGSTELFPRHWTLTPETGLLLVFPAWVTHFVHPYVGKRPRVAAAYNAWFTA